MLYTAKEVFDRTVVDPTHMTAHMVAVNARAMVSALDHIPYGEMFAAPYQAMGAAAEYIVENTRKLGKPEWRLAANEATGQITQRAMDVPGLHPICKLVEFSPARETGDPVLLIAPMSGHWATLIRPSVQRMLDGGRRVYVTDWENARDLPASQRFDLDDYTDTLMKVFRFLGGSAHAIAICQPSVPLVMAVSLMEAAGDPNVPKSMILKGGPIDTRISPTEVNRLAEKRGIGWFEQNVISHVPLPYQGVGRPVYPGFLQLYGFMAMNMDRHLKAHREQFNNLVRGDHDSADKHREFYGEYKAVQDLAAEYFLPTVKRVFIEHHLAKGEMMYRGAIPVNPAAIRRVPVMTVEGEIDDITGIGQCASIHDLCSGLKPWQKSAMVQEGAGHYAIFSGGRYRNLIAPKELAFMDAMSRRNWRSGWRPEARPQMVAGGGSPVAPS
jgi:poly(3-hydroxybutyrate) depolymerase